MVSQHADAIAAEYCIAEGGSNARIGGKVNYAAVEMTEKLPRRMELGRAQDLPGTRRVHCRETRSHPPPPWPRSAGGACRSANATTTEFSNAWRTSCGAGGRALSRAARSGIRHADAADKYLAENAPGYASMLRTSISPTMIEGGYRINVIPSEAKATLDVRMLPDENADQFLAAMTRVINDPSVVARFVNDTGALRPSRRPARIDSEAFPAITSATSRNYTKVKIPTMGTGATDMAPCARKARSVTHRSAADVEDGRKVRRASDQERTRASCTALHASPTTS
jgi:metal-dependent amidase/aminoacylase/carboxypeptidase family protein